MGPVRRRGDHVRVTLDRTEADLLASLVGQVRALLGEGTPADPQPRDADPIDLLEASLGNPPSRPEGPILERLLPDGYRDDPEAAGEFRRLTDADLRATKREALDQVRRDIEAAESSPRGRRIIVDLDEPRTTQWLHALADVRLALGVRLGVSEDTRFALDDLTEDPALAAELALYDWLTWLQDAVVRQAPV